jgi:hypothetical protein
MLYWHFRNFQCMVYGLLGKRLANPWVPLVRSFFANPFDSDWFRSIQAGRFFTYTDAARWEIAFRIGFLKPALKNKWVVILGGQKIVYRKPVKIFRKFQLEMKLDGCDDKWFYAVHHFRQDNQLKCVSFSKIGIRGPKGLVNPFEVVKHLGNHEIKRPSLQYMKYFDNDREILVDSVNYPIHRR